MTKPVPVIVTVVPPAVGPAVGLIDVTVGAGVVGVVVAALRGRGAAGGGDRDVDGAGCLGGAVAVIWLSESTVKPVPAVAPKSTVGRR